MLVPRLLAIDGLRVLIVDDGSPDGTGAEADRLATASGGRLSVMHRTGLRGLGRSYVDGMQAAVHDRRALHLPDGRRPLARPRRPASPPRGRRRSRPRHRVALRAGRHPPQLAAPPSVAERVRQLVRALHHRPAHPRLHQRLPLLAPRPAGPPAAGARSHPTATRSRWKWPGKRRRAGATIVEAPITFVERRQGVVEALGRGDRRIGVAALAAGHPRHVRPRAWPRVQRAADWYTLPVPCSRRASRPSISVFFPCYNDEQTIAGLVREADAQLRCADRRLRDHRRERRVARRQRRRARRRSPASIPRLKVITHAGQPRLRRRAAVGIRERDQGSGLLHRRRRPVRREGNSDHAGAAHRRHRFRQRHEDDAQRSRRTASSSATCTSS